MPESTSTGSRNSFGFLTRKLGPAPVWLWALLAVGAYYLYTKYKSGSSSSTAAATGADAIDPATGITYAQELSDAEDQITQLQAQVNQQSQGQTAPTTIDITQSQTQTQTQAETEPGSGTPAPKPPAPKPAAGKVRIPDVAGKRAAFAVDELHSLGFQVDTDPLRKPVDEYDATGTTPAAGTEAPKGSKVAIHVKEIAAPKTTTKAKAKAKPRRPAPVRITTPARVVKPKPATTPARRAA